MQQVLAERDITDSCNLHYVICSWDAELAGIIPDDNVWKRQVVVNGVHGRLPSPYRFRDVLLKTEDVEVMVGLRAEGDHD